MLDNDILLSMTPNEPEIADPKIHGHPIAVVAERTGLSRDVLRVWERRYRAVEPTRTPGGQRIYTDADVQRFQLLAAATRHGRNISAVAGVPTAELAALVAADDAALSAKPVDAPAPDLDATVEAAIDHTRALDGSGLDRLLRRALARYGLPSFVGRVVPSFMHRIGDDWSSGDLGVAHEHLASASVLAIIGEALRTLPAAPAAERIVVATPSGELHAVGAALAATAAALDGWNVVHLGADVPAADIVTAARTTGARAVVLSVVHTDNPDRLLADLQAIRAGVGPHAAVVIGGAATDRLSARIAEIGVVVCPDFEALRPVLAGAPVPA